MKRSHGLLLIAGCLLMAALSVTAFAQTDPYGTQPQPAQASQSSTLTGRVVSTDTSSLVVRSDTGAQVNFVLDGGSSLPLEMSSGDRVDVDYQTADGGKLHAVKVTNLSAGSQASPAGGSPSSPAGPAASTASSGSNSGAASGVAADDQGKTGKTKAMPRTASPLPLVGLMGLLSLGAALTLRVASRERA